MNKQAPSIGQLITLSGFVLACFGLLLFVWVAFGGPTPLAASGYKLSLPMTQIGQLAEQSQVKISGVEVGRVSGVELGEGEAHWPTLRPLLTKARIAGPAVHDARIAALCLQHGVQELWSADRDFGRFVALRVVNPLSAH